MSWAKLDDQFHANKKIALLDPDLMLAALGLHLLALSWVASELTDGFVPKNQVRRLGADRSALDLAEDLVKATLWEHADGGYAIHDYLDYNPSRAEVLAAQAAMSEGGRRGARARWAKKGDSPPHDLPHGDPQGVPQEVPHGPPYENGLPHGDPYRVAMGSGMGSACPVPVPIPQDLSSEDAAATSRARARGDEPPGDPGSSSIEDGTPETPPPQVPDPMDDDDPMDALLLELWEVEGWKRKPKQDRDDLARLGAAFPRADLAVAIQQLRAKAADGEVKAGPRSALQAFIKQLHLQTPEPQSYPEEDDHGPRPIADWAQQAECAKEAAAQVRRLAAGGGP